MQTRRSCAVMHVNGTCRTAASAGVWHVPIFGGAITFYTVISLFKFTVFPSLYSFYNYT